MTWPRVGKSTPRAMSTHSGCMKPDSRMGTPVTAQDVVYSVDRWVEPGAIRSRTGVMRQFLRTGQRQSHRQQDSGNQAENPCRNVHQMDGQRLDEDLPAARGEGQSQDDLNCCPENLIGSGPFIFKSWGAGGFLLPREEPDYFKPGLPYLDGFKVFLIKDYQRRVASIKTEQVMGDYRLSSGSVSTI